MSSFCLALLAVAIGRDRSVRESDEGPPAAPAVVTGVLFVVALVVSLLVPSTGYYPLLLLVATDGVISLWRKLIARFRS